MAKIGDIVRYLNSIGGGRITRIENNIAYVEEEDGFETPVLLRECVVVASGDAAAPRKAAPAPMATVSQPAKNTTTPTPAAVSETDMEETPEGEKLNVVLAYEPAEIKHLNTTTHDVYLVNDSNYYLYFAYMTRADEATGWTTRYAGIVEPNIQVWLEEITTADLPSMDRIAVQYIAFKQGREFKLKSPGAIETKLDTSKFFKLHCFHDNPYFEKPVIAVDIVKNDIPQRAMILDSGRLEEGIRVKKAADRPARKPVKKHKSVNNIIEVDLHIAELVDSTRGLSNADMLNIQIDEFRRVMDANLNKKGQKIVFIHGKGEGILRQAIMKELNHRYKGHAVQDASFREYGFGATQVTI